MKKVEQMVPFIDIIFQAMGALIVVMATLQHVEAIPVGLATVGKEAAVTKKTTDPLFVSISGRGFFAGKMKVKAEELSDITAGREVILRIDKNIPYGEVVGVVGDIRKSARNIALEVKTYE